MYVEGYWNALSNTLVCIIGVDIIIIIVHIFLYLPKGIESFEDFSVCAKEFKLIVLV
jgi:hypothetical protein